MISMYKTILSEAGLHCRLQYRSNMMLFIKVIFLFAIFSNVNCTLLFQRGNLFFEPHESMMAIILNQHPIDYETGLKEESNKGDEDPRIRLLRKRGMRTEGKIRKICNILFPLWNFS